jgi:DNA-binding FadR family transcriptional regulator
LVRNASGGFRHARSVGGATGLGPIPGAGAVRTAAKPRGSASIAAELRRAIAEGGYAYGDKLPTERQLARLFKVSRTTVRNALELLERGHLVARRVGSGTFVSYRPVAGEGEIAEITSPLELIEVRLAVEPHATRLAVANATARDLDHLGEALVRLEGSGADTEHFTRWDVEFHQRLAECAHNPLLAWIYGRINEVRRHAQWRAMKDKILTAERIADYNRQHRALYESLRSRDVEKAVGSITEHLEKARCDLLGVDRD